ncbi:Bud site selection protein 6 [Nowakowskiella sp. JEL0407]|nr:Bud site selection protein 6 [Nowakowskiella sp. JEL0407]
MSETNITLFLQVDNEIIRLLIPNDIKSLSESYLRDLFITNFPGIQYKLSPKSSNSSVDLLSNTTEISSANVYANATIYIRDEKHREFYRISKEDFVLISERQMAFLRLHSPGITLESLKKHIDLSIHSLSREIQSLKASQASKPLENILPPLPVKKAVPNVNITPNLKQKLSSQLQELKKTRQNLSGLRLTYNNLQISMKSTISTLLTHTNRIISQPVAVHSTVTLRSDLLATKSNLEQTMQSIPAKITHLQTHLEDLKDDVTERKIIPLQSQISYILGESLHLQSTVAELTEDLVKIKSTWKHTWEEELKGIVKEQGFLKQIEGMRDDWEDQLSECLELVQTLQQVIEFQKERVNRRKSGEILGTVIMDVAAPEDVPNIFNMILDEIKMVVNPKSDSEKRLDAIGRNERRRKFEKEREEEDKNEFSTELKKFVGSGKLKRTGGVDAVESVRLQRQRETFKAMFTSVL